MQQKIVDYLAGVFYLATIEGDQPRVRPFDAAAEVDGKVYIGTLNTKKVYQQILKQPKVEIYVEAEEGSMRIAAEAFIVEDAVKNREIYVAMGKNPENPAIAVIGLKNIKGYLINKAGEKEEIDLD